jgi:hypothetical protein
LPGWRVATPQIPTLPVLTLRKPKPRGERPGFRWLGLLSPLGGLVIKFG